MNQYRTKPECGTKSGYDWHTRQTKEEPCTLCREASSLHWRKQRILRADEINSRRRLWRRRNNRTTGIHWNQHKDEIIELYGTQCHICGTEINLEAPSKVGQPGWELGFQPDHVISLSRGGKDDLDNVRPSHAYCNQKKWATA
jgi:hypothetical protein